MTHVLCLSWSLPWSVVFVLEKHLHWEHFIDLKNQYFMPKSMSVWEWNTEIVSWNQIGLCQSFLETVHFVSLRGSHLCWMALELNQSSWCDIMWWKSVERFVENMLHSGNEIKSHNNGTESPADGNLCPMDLCTTTDFIQYHPSPHGGWRR